MIDEEDLYRFDSMFVVTEKTRAKRVVEHQVQPLSDELEEKGFKSNDLLFLLSFFFFA